MKSTFIFNNPYYKMLKIKGKTITLEKFYNKIQKKNI